MKLEAVSQSVAFDFIDRLHRHHKRPVGWKCGQAVSDGTGLHGVITLGRPISRVLAARGWLEVTRNCTDGTKNAASCLYGWARREARKRGAVNCVTYTLASEPGTSLIAAGWKRAWTVRGRTWSCPSRPRQTYFIADKVAWTAW